MESLKSSLSRSQTILLSVIAIFLVLITIKMYIPEAHADDGQIISRILFSIDGSTISGGGRLSTYCNS